MFIELFNPLAVCTAAYYIEEFIELSRDGNLKL